MKKNKSLFMAIALLVLSIVIIAGSTYAYYIATINNDNASDVDIQARTLGLHFTDGAEINLPNALPGVTVIKKFSVTNTGTESTTYNIYINDLVNDFINTDELVYELTSTNGGATITETVFPTASGAIASNIEIPTDTTQEYTMTIRYLNTNSSQNIDMGKKISGLIQISEGIEGISLSGKAFNNNGDLLTSGYVEIHSKVLKANINNDGSFNFVNVPTGSHTIIFYDNNDQVLQSSNIEISKSNSNDSTINNGNISIGTNNSIDILFNLNDDISMTIMPNNYQINLEVINGSTDINKLSYIDGSSYSINTLITPNTHFVFDTVTCSNGQNVTYQNNQLRFNNITSDTTCTIEFVKPTCTRAETLHTEICNQTQNYYCIADGYLNGSTITYGNFGTRGVLTVGDAFDCDVNGDGTYDAATERFYYVTDMNSDTAVMIYYSDVTSGIPNSVNTYAYNTSTGYLGLQSSTLAQLPTTSQWSNVHLTNTTRNILDQSNVTRVSNYNYSGYAARLLTTQELASACSLNVTANIQGSLSNKCRFILEHTSYSSSANISYGTWLENRYSTTEAWEIDAGFRYPYHYNASKSGSFGVRPVIEVSKTDIEI